MVDFERQFVPLDEAGVQDMNAKWLRRTGFDSAERAFEYARQLERQGLDVAFAKHGDSFLVWVGQRPSGD
jgi:hypothetical protein